MSKKKESIWTKDLTPGFVNFMTMDITPDFTSPLWTEDITHHIIGTMAVFGLVVSSFVTIVGVAAVSTNAELALAQMVSANQTAAVVVALTTSPVIPPPPPVSMGSTTPGASGMMGTSTPQFCPQISRTIMRGNSDATSTGDVTQLQLFLSNHFGLNSTSTVTGYFGSTTQNYLERFQQSQGIPPAPTAGPLTRAAIQKICGGGQMPPLPQGQNGQMGSSSPALGTSTRPSMPPPPPMHNASSTTMMGSSTQPMPPPPARPMSPHPQASTSPVSFTDSPESDNAASAIVGVEEISDGVNRLLQASLGVLGL